MYKQKAKRPKYDKLHLKEACREVAFKHGLKILLYVITINYAYLCLGKQNE